MIVTVSVPHSGTHFTWELLKSVGYAPRTKSSDSGERKYGHIHTYGTDNAAEQLADAKARGWRVIVPLRHPMATAQTHKNRRKGILDGKNPMLRCWRSLIEEAPALDPLWLPIDTPDRQRYLGKINAELGVEIVTDWKPVSHYAKEHHALTRAEIDAVRELLDDPFVTRFYD